MRNTINGYGNEYIIPTYTVLDELIEEYGYSEASQKIKEIRKTMRKMIKDRTAAKCDYADHYRADNAKDFVIDAFNGKVATIMAKVKHDNYGILRQKIIDAFHLVNKLGKPFQNARVTNEYLQLKLDELKYATFLKELKLKDMEEQRRIREQMREEEKARREIEKALKEAQKEEEMLQKAMEKVRAELAVATEQQKAKYEAQLEKLKQKLEEAEARNQRAISMAQQTKAGHVYIISNIGSFGENVYKIGMTRRLEPLDRVRELGDASVPFPFDVHALIYSENAPELENRLHKFFEEKRMNKVNLRKEFFKVTIAEIKEFLEKEGIEAKWTIQAEAAEYRETLAIEEGLKKGTYTKDRFGHFVPVKLEEYERN
ncbi:Chromosome segregation ATPase [Marinitoga phage MPV1]